ncbi:hypothetical protein HPNQ4216_1260 [Helicobacter pylori NQ4216]|nr:hypothetical protein HPNQ4216_1260 [Helicobacter pylori NQ4216]
MAFKYSKLVCATATTGAFKCLAKMVFKSKRAFKKNFGAYPKLMTKSCVDYNSS